jgi:hypothetical protein
MKSIVYAVSLAITLSVGNLSAAGGMSPAKDFHPNVWKFKKNDECTPIRLDKQEPLNRIPITNQGGLFNCGAHATATLLDFERLTRNPQLTTFVSPIALAASFAVINGNRDISAEHPIRIAELAARGALIQCDRGRIPEDPRVNWGRLVTRLYEAREQVRGDLLRDALVRAGFNASALSGLRPTDTYISMPFVTMFKTIVDDLCRSAPLEPLPQLVIDMRIIFNHVHRSRSIVDEQVRVRQIIDSRLEAGKPTAINYCGEVRYNAAVQGITESGKLASVCKTSEFTLGHSSVIVGRRLLRYRDAGQQKTICQYLVRDSFGEDCGRYPPDPNSTPSERCERGQVWIDEDALFVNVAEAFWYR